MRLPHQPNAHYLRLPTLPEAKGVGDAYPGVPDVVPLYSEEEYDLAWTLSKRVVRRQDDTPEAMKVMIVTLTDIYERYRRIMTDPANRDLMDRYCIIDRSDLSWLISDPFMASRPKFAMPRQHTLQIGWTTADKTVAVEAALRFADDDNDFAACRVWALFFAIMLKSTKAIEAAQKKFQEVMMREWLSQIIPTGDDGQPVRGYTIRCFQCSAVEHFKGTKFGADKAAEIVPKHFKQKGWIVHNKRDDQDTCPACVNAKTLQRRAERGLTNPPSASEAVVEITSPEKPLKTMGDLKKVVSIRPLPKPAEAPAMTASLAPTRAQNRLIQDALSKVYPVAEQGYTKGASDHTVAAALNLPVDWIRSHREQFFGPPERIDLTTTEQRIATLKNRMSELEEKGLKEVSALKAQVEAREKAALAEIETMKRIVKEVEDKTLAGIDALRDEVTDLGKEMDGIRQRLGDVA